MNKISLTIILSIVLVFPPEIFAQINKDEIRRIDSLFISWNQPNHPGGSIGVMKEGKVIFSKAYGLASLEYLVPNTPDTRFNIASVSKQFTCMGIVLLHLQGKISLDDDVRKHLPELPVFKDTITIRHLIHHTSGMRSLHALLGMAGWRGDDSRTNEDLFRFMRNQKDLNFKPGAEYLYCNTGYMLMADIIEKITEEKFAIWMYDNLFEPLGMINTYVEDDYSRVVPVNATSYYGSASHGFSRSVEYWGYVGSGNIHSTTKDLLVWLTNFYHPPTGWEEAFQIMQTQGMLNNGDTLDYSFGININKYKEEQRISHGGSIGGYRSIVQAFPDHGLNIAILTNFSSSNTSSKMNRISDILLNLDAEAEPELITAGSISSRPMSNEDLVKFCGHYWNEKSQYTRKIYLKDDTLRYFRPESSESKLLPVEENTFQMLNVAFDIKVSFEILSNKQKVMRVQVDNEDPICSESYDPPEMIGEFLNSYTGRYYSPELDTHYTLYVLGDSVLMGNHSRHGDFDIKIIREDYLEGKLWAFNGIKVKRDKKKKILGLLVSNGRVRNLWFEKQ
jgi:CubicO group peptidase (beta-lactamase class C family)